MTLEFKYDTQLLIEGKDLSQQEIESYITHSLSGDSLIVAGDDELIKIHFHTNEPWKLLEFCARKGDVFDVVVENMQRQSDGLQG